MFSQLNVGSAGIGPSTETTVGGFLILTIWSAMAGMILSLFRWLLVDTLHHATGVKPARLEFSRLEENINAFQLVVEHQYHYYQFYSNLLIALLVVGTKRLFDGTLTLGTALLGLVLLATLWIASRQTLSKYYQRAGEILRCEHST